MTLKRRIRKDFGSYLTQKLLSKLFKETLTLHVLTATRKDKNLNI